MKRTSGSILRLGCGALVVTLLFFGVAEGLLRVAMGRKVLAVSGDRKIESFMEAAGLGDWVCDLGEVGCLPERLQALGGQPDRSDFVIRARREHRCIADRIRRIAGELDIAGAGWT